MNKKIFLTSIFCIVFSINVQAGFFEAIGDFFSNLGNFLFGGGNQETQVTTFERPPEIETRALDPVVRPCQSRISPNILTSEERRWQDSGFVEPEQTVIVPVIESNAEMTHEMELQSVVLRGSGWDTEGAIQHLNTAANVLAQCGIKVKRATITEVTEPDGNVDYLSIRGLSESDPRFQQRQDQQDNFSRRTPTNARPMVVFARDTGAMNDAYANVSPSFRNNNTQILPEHYDMIPRLNHTFVSRGVERSYPRFSAVAHELAHMLCQCSHHDGEPNLLTTNPSSGARANYIPPNMCRIFKRSPLVRRIR